MLTFGRKKKATLRVLNETGYRTDHLRAFAVAARDIVFNGKPEHRLVVTFKKSRRSFRGVATLGGNRSTIWMPTGFLLDVERKLKLAKLLIHEFAHNAGAKGERWMRRSAAYGFRHPQWKANVLWAETLPLELKPEASKQTAASKNEAVLALIEKRTAEWTRRQKRAATALRKLARRRGYYQRRLAAMKGGQS